MRAQQTAVAVFAVGAVALDKRDMRDCLENLMSINDLFMEAPTPDLSLALALAEETALLTATNPCDVPMITGAAGEGFTSYYSEVSSWYEENADVFTSFLGACSDVPGYEDAASVLSMQAGCSSVTWAQGGSGSGAEETSTATADTTVAATATATATDDETETETPTEDNTETVMATAPTPSSDGQDSDNSDNASGRMVVAMGAGLAAVGAFVVAL